jgi:4-amino-4-deoxy-L-arabinose transferase-like glycosyltransferase
MKNESLLVLAFAAAGVLLFQALQGPQPIDDAFITYRYARSLTSGAGFVYNLGEKVLGTTTPLYTLILSAFAFIFGSRSIPAISFTVALVADTVNIILLYRLTHHIPQRSPGCSSAERGLPAAARPLPGGSWVRQPTPSFCI